MSWKTSIISINTANQEVSDEKILDSFNLEDYSFKEDTHLQKCMYQDASQICIGKYNSNYIIIGPQRLLRRYYNTEEQKDEFLALFPLSRIAMASANSATKFQAYSIFDQGKKIRFKSVSESDSKTEMGNKIPAESIVYNSGHQQNEVYTWKENGVERTEADMYEEFTFEILKSNLGLNLLSTEAESLMEDIPFKCYKIEFKREFAPKKKRNKWLFMVLFFILFIAWQLLRKMYGM